MKTKKEIVQNWLPRYTGVPLEEFGEYILLTNFGNYVETVRPVAWRAGARRGPADAERDRRRHHHHQLRHGQRRTRRR